MKYSIVLPAYNEQKRIGIFLEELILFCRKKLKDFEIIIVNDGSTDNTLDVLKKYRKKIKIISYSINKGKGYAVKTGMLAAKGDKIVFLDSDGAYPPENILKIFSALENYDVAAGTKRSKDSRWYSSEPFLRKLMSFVYNAFIIMLFRERIWDAGCGIKGFRKNAARYLASNLISAGWTFDVELMVRAYRKKYKIKRIPVSLYSVKGSKLKIVDPLKMTLNIIKLKYLLDIKNGRI
ncbi:glycosyltransferase [Candidatus Pacearchaeota archaeon]|nr:glycosyltransferase [Candidatus Pacearchaeota archaeon]